MMFLISNLLHNRSTRLTCLTCLTTVRLSIITTTLLFLISTPLLAQDNNKTCLAQSVDLAVILAERSDADRARDKWRHPQQTLAFFEVEPDMTVVELWPGSGWYSRVLAPYLHRSQCGKLYAAHFPLASADNPSSYFYNLVQEYKKVMANNPDFKNISLTSFGSKNKKNIDPIAPVASADRVLSFRNAHNWIQRGIFTEAIKSAYVALKPGGIFGIVGHRAPIRNKHEKQLSPLQHAKTGYVPQRYIIDSALAAGFYLIDSSEINANPLDSADHKDGVWSLPPSYRTTRNNREPLYHKYNNIGESDRFTLKFQKPLKS